MKKKSYSPWRDFVVTLVVIVLQLLPVAMISLFVCWVTGIAPIVGLIIGIIIWTLVFFSTPMFEWFFINVAPNFSVILSSQIRNSPMVSGVDQTGRDLRTKMTNSKSFREVGTGWKGKMPWEIPFESVDHKAEVILDNGDGPLVCYTLEGIEINVNWQVVLTPLVGHLTNLARRGQEATRAYFKGLFEGEIISWVQGKEEKVVLESVAHLKMHFNQVLGGKNKVSLIEEEHGVFTNDPQITAVKRSSSYAKAAEAGAVGVQMINLIGPIKKLLPGVDDNVVLIVAGAVTGNNVNGLLVIPGLSGMDQKTIAALSGLAKGVTK